MEEQKGSLMKSLNVELLKNQNKALMARTRALRTRIAELEAQNGDKNSKNIALNFLESVVSQFKNVQNSLYNKLTKLLDVRVTLRRCSFKPRP